MPEAALRPQPGPQTEFLRSLADVCFYGGSAGSGKSFALLMEVLYHHANPQFRAVIFRRTRPHLKLQGGLWDTSAQVYALLGATPNQTELQWKFKSGAVVQFAGMEHESDRFGWQGAQIPFIAFDEVTQFTDPQFWYMFSRLRSMSGVKGYVRCTCNPDPDSWVRTLLDWWIDNDTGFAIPQRSGVLRWFVRSGDELYWGATKAELEAKFGADSQPKSLTFIPAKISDNPILLEKDPGYMANLKSLSRVDRARLLDGNWNVRAAAGNYFRREWFQMVPAASRLTQRCRFWDRAASLKLPGTDPDATVGVLLSRDKTGIYYIEDVRKLFDTPLNVERAMLNCAIQDGPLTRVSFMRDPGSAGIAEADDMTRKLSGFDVRILKTSKDKETRARPVSSQAEAGNIKVVRAMWNDPFLKVLENFPDATHDDEVDALSGAFEMLGQSNGAFSSPAEISVSPPLIGQFSPDYLDLVELTEL